MRDKGFRDREGRESNGDRFRDRFERPNSHQENGAAQDNRSQGSARRAGDNFGRTRTRLDDGEDIEEAEQKRGMIGRGKLDQPWFRDGTKVETKEVDGATNPAGDRGWRNKDFRNEKDWTRGARVEQDPQWMTEASAADMADHTQDDFQKWKDRMKAGPSATDDQSAMLQETTSGSGPAPAPITPVKDAALESGKNEDMFKMWIEPKREELAFDGLGSTPRGGAKPKSSRFAGFFGPAQQELPAPAPPPPENVFANPVPSSPAKTSSEDQEGFRRMMEMLRMGGTSSQAPLAQLLGRPPADAQPAETRSQAGPWPEKEKRTADPQQQSRQPSTPIKHSLPPQQPQQQPQSRSQPQPQPQMAKPVSRPEPASRDSEFLLKLMQQQYQQPRSPFTEGQIYGQSYSRKDSAEISNLLNNFKQQPKPRSESPPVQGLNPQVQTQPRGPKSRGAPPPGFFGNDRAFGANQHIEAQLMPEHVLNASAMDDRVGRAGQRQLPHDQRFQHLPPFDQAAPPPSNRTATQASEAIAPPPGFTGMHGPAPPGFFAFPGGNNPINHQHTSGPQPMRNPMPQPQPLGFYNNQVPGAVPGHGHPVGFAQQQQQQLQQQLQQQQQQQQQQIQARRLSQLQPQMPPPLPPQTFPGNFGPQARRPPSMVMMPSVRAPSPGMGQYPQYLKQHGGGGAGGY